MVRQRDTWWEVRHVGGGPGGTDGGRGGWDKMGGALEWDGMQHVVSVGGHGVWQCHRRLQGCVEAIGGSSDVHTHPWGQGVCWYHASHR